jgi:hypothetical protein
VASANTAAAAVTNRVIDIIAASSFYSLRL